MAKYDAPELLAMASSSANAVPLCGDMPFLQWTHP
jgi:hypothetical protein